MITLNGIEKKFGSRTLFEGVSFTFNSQSKYGLTGPNGAGKSTLMKIMMGVEESTAGSVSLPENVGFLKQNIEEYAERSLIDVVIEGNQKLWEALEARDALYLEEFTDEIGMKLGDMEEIIGLNGGYTAEPDAEVLLEGMGIPAAHYNSKMSQMPTDVQFKVLLCQALFGQPEALLLDEPTNHLGLDSITWLETFLKEYRGSVIVISHDRHFLNAVTTHIADIDYDTIIVYPGNYDSMIEAKNASRDHEQIEIKNKEKKIAHLQDFVSKFGAGTRASQVKSRVREIERLKPQDLKKSNIQRPYIRFSEPGLTPGQSIFDLHAVCKKYDDIEVYKNLSLEIHRGDKIGVIGNNGSGKTTLLKMLAGLCNPDKGKTNPGYNLSVGYFPQKHEEITGEYQNYSLFDFVKSQKNQCSDQGVRDVLGKLLFAGDDAFKKISSLSGGETARAILAVLMLLDNNTLLLDEPNNHLDLEAVSALGWGLSDYPGTIVCVSHNRDLITSFATKIIALDDDGVHVFQGGLEEYMESKKQ